MNGRGRDDDGVSHTRRPLTARARILGAVLIVAFVGLALVGTGTFVVQRARTVSAIDDRLQSQVSSLRAIAGPTPAPTAHTRAAPTTTATEPLAIDDYPSVVAYLKAAVARLLPAEGSGSVAAIDGVPRFQPAQSGGIELSGQTALIRAADSQTRAADTAVIATAHTDIGTLRYIAVPVRMAGDPDRGLYIRAVNLDTQLAPVTALAATYAVCALIMLAAIGTVGWFVTGRLLSPIRHLRDTADSITLADLGTRIPAPGNDDISELMRTVNSMLDRLERSVDAQRQLLDDVRHELKTPITIVRGHLEMMDASDPEDVRGTRALGIAELDRMAHLIEDIDLLASVEAGEQFTMRDVGVLRLTARVGELVTGYTEHVWTIATTASAVVHGDPDRLIQAWLQLADNAAKYAPAGTPVDVGSSVADGVVHLWVRDHGPGIPPAARRRIFRRFDRGGGRRTVGGSGLGLAIVDAIAKAHAGSCAVTETPGGGATFSIAIPQHTGPSSVALPQPVRAGDVLLQREAAQ